ncbi:divergent polysaccharide deacetylase family protein [Rhizobium sp. CSW-27]|uniref:divergent polysaccharide deacetylase family protein n=1 Tax=Rhizobium sp. CSW-27 TaxID=2839985 RepID=UPI001C01183D|nr:divergent polysaccharide deacetylase family protein [Rhizobium sp. CSW-27]
MGTDLRAPLGGRDRRRTRSGRGLTLAAVLTGCGAAALLALSFYAMRSSGLPPVDPVAVTLAVPPLPAASAGAAPSPEPAASPSLSPSTPEAASAAPLAAESGRAGTEIARTRLEDGSVVTTFSPRRSEAGGPRLIDARRPGQDPRLAALPDDDLLEDTPFGRLPVRGPDGLRPMEQYARPWSGARGTRIAIVIGGLGISQTGTQRAIRQLPGSVTLAFAASGNSLQRWQQEARTGGHEILLQVPMEPFDYPANDPGPLTLVTGRPAAQNLKALHQAMGRMSGYTGIVNFLGGRYLADPQALEPVLQDIAARGLLFVDDGAFAQSKTQALAGALDLPHGFADVRLDDQLQRDVILRKLDDLQRIAERRGSAIGIGTAFDETVDAVAEWMKQAEGRGIEVVGVSALVSGPQQQ